MPRKTPVKEIQEEETNPGSPLRRSTRLRNSSPVPTKVVTRRSSASEVTTSTPKVNKSRRPSYNQDSESISSSTLNKKADNSVLKEKENGKDETNLVSSEAVLDKKKVPRRRRSSVEDIQNNQNETVEALTNSKTVDTKESPIKKKSLDSKKTLESIEEINGEAESPVAEKSKTNFVAQRKKSDPIKIDLNLSVIKETSFTEADKDIENEEKEATENQIEHKTSPLKTSNLVKEETLPLLKSSSVDKNVNQSDGPYEANASVNSLHLELSSELNNKDETVPSISNKENICPTEEKLIQEPEEPMDIDESQSSLFLSETLSSAKNEDGNLTLNTSVKNDEITKKLEIVEKDNDEIAKFLLEETKSSSSNKSQNESENNKQIEEPKEPDIDVNGTCEDNKKVSLENSVVTKPEVKENESLIEEDEISLQIKETEESTKVDEISLQVKKTEETIKNDEISLQIEETEETMKDDEISLPIKETEETIKDDEISLQIEETEESIKGDEISLQVKKTEETINDDEISIQVKKTEETVKDDEISLQIKETEESTKVDEISLQVKKTEETIKDDEISLQIEETIKDDEMSLQIEETEETIIKDCKPIHNSKEEKDTFQNAQILDSKITENSEMQVSEEKPEELHQEEKKTDSSDTTIVEKNEEILNKSSDSAGSDKMLLENTKTNKEQCHLPQDTKINEENTKIITEMHDSSEDTKTKEEDSHLSKNTKTKEIPPSPESNKKIQESIEMKHKDEEIKVPKEETYKCQENVKIIKMSSKRRIVSTESQDDSVQIEESQTPEKMNFDSTLNSFEEYESKNSDYSTKDSPTTNQNTSKETEICVPTQMETSPAESLDKVSSTITTHENNSIKKSENKIDKCEEKNESDILHQNATIVCKEKFSKVVDLSENNQDKENGDSVRLLKKTSFIIRRNIKNGEDKERHIHDCISKLSTLMNARIKNKGDVSIKFLAEYTCEDSTGNEIFSQAESDALSGNLECEKEEDENNTSPIKIHRIQTPYKSSTYKEKLEDMKTNDGENSESEESSEDFTWVPSDDEIMSDASTSEDSCREESLMEELNELEEEEEENQPELLENQKKRKTRKLFRLSTYDVSELLVRNSPEIRTTKTEEKKQDNAKQKRKSPDIRTTKIENNEKQNTSIKKTKIPEFIVEEFQDNKAKKRKHLAIETPNNSFLAEKADDIRPAKKKALSDEFLDKKIVVKPSTSGSEGWKTKI